MARDNNVFTFNTQKNGLTFSRIDLRNSIACGTHESAAVSDRQIDIQVRDHFNRLDYLIILLTLIFACYAIIVACSAFGVAPLHSISNSNKRQTTNPLHSSIAIATNKYDYCA